MVYKIILFLLVSCSSLFATADLDLVRSKINNPPPAVDLSKLSRSMFGGSQGGLSNVKAPKISNPFGGLGGATVNNGLTTKDLGNLPAAKLPDFTTYTSGLSFGGRGGRGVRADQYLPPGPTDLKVMISTDWSTGFISTWRIVGFGFCVKKFKVRTCIRINHNWPTGLSEVVKKLGDTHVQSPIPLVYNKIVLNVAKNLIRSQSGITPGGGHTKSTSSKSQSSWQYFDAHVYGYPNPILYMEILAEYNPYMKVAYEIIKRLYCDPQNRQIIYPVYSTEFDFMFWRTGLMDTAKTFNFRKLIKGTAGCVADTKDLVPGMKSLIDQTKFCVGNYGPIYPRIGFVSHWSETTGSVLTMFRSFSMAHNGGALRAGKYNFRISPGHLIQQLEPHKSSCWRVGGNYLMNPGFRHRSPDGKYFYIHFPKLSCCSGCEETRQID